MIETPRIRPPYTVSELTEEIRLRLEKEYEWVQVRGEISNFKKGPTGHAYFRLKDGEAILECVAWRTTVVRWAGLDLRDGIEVIAGGKLTIYPPRGQYQLVVSAIRPAGLGALQQQFEALKQRLAREGLFDAARKKLLPPLPRRIAVITSPTGAAVRDFIKIIRRSACPVHLTVCPVLVQGEEAAGEIEAMLQRVNRQGDFDLIVLCRGGGSLEDLWAFNEERTVRAIVASRIPVLTGIGHEIDFTIADFVADRRASTPTAAAQMICEGFDQSRARLHLLRDRLLRAGIVRLEREKERIETVRQTLRRYHPLSLSAQYRQRLDDRWSFLNQHIQATLRESRSACSVRRRELEKTVGFALEQRRQNFQRFQRLLHSYNPQKILERGFAVCWDEQGGALTRISDIHPNDSVWVRLADGSFHSQVIEVKTAP